MNQPTKATTAELEQAIHERHMQRVRSISAKTFFGKPHEQQAARNAELAASELQAARERHFLNLNR